MRARADGGPSEWGSCEMAVEWVVCPGCGLKHSRRADDTCPRCKSDLRAVPNAQGPSPVGPVVRGPLPSSPLPARPVPSRPIALFDRESPGAPPEPAPSLWSGPHLAGAVLLLNAVLGLVERTAAQGTSPAASYLIDAVIGISLLRGSTAGLAFAKFRCVVGTLVLTVLFASRGDAILAGVQFFYGATLLVLLTGGHGTRRVRAAAIAAVLLLLVNTLGVLAAVGRSAPAPRAAATSQVVRALDGDAFAYRLTPPDDKWRQRDAAAMKKDNPVADAWIVHSLLDAHVVVVAESVPGDGPVAMEAFADTVRGNLKRNWKDYRELAARELATDLDAALLLHSRGKAGAVEIEGYHGLFMKGRSIFQVWAFSDPRTFSRLRGDLEKIIGSFELTAP